jgi:hypothetical protein
MPCFTCGTGTSYLGSRPGVFAAFSRAAAKSAAAKLRGLCVLANHRDWPARAAACERCPMRVSHAGVSYCGTPFLRRPLRDAGLDGCGCPTVAKAKDPAEHCPLNAANRAAGGAGGACDCKWCQPAVSPPGRSGYTRPA